MSDVEDTTFATLTAALKKRGIWSPKVTNVQDAQAYILDQLSLPGTRGQHLAILQQMLQEASNGRTDAVLVLMERLSNATT